MLSDYHLATGYEGLQLAIQFQRGLYEECSWHYGNMRIILSVSKQSCINENQTSHTLTCSLTDDSIDSRLTILSAATVSSPIRVECQRDLLNPSTIVELDSFHLNVTGAV